jgi:carboxyl-terminal processing protease
VKAGDEILTVDGVGVAGLTVDDVVDRVRGPEGSDVTLELKSPEGVTRSVTITRAKLDLPRVSLRARDEERGDPPRVVLVGAPRQSPRPSAGRSARARGRQLDLRSNPGG